MSSNPTLALTVTLLLPARKHNSAASTPFFQVKSRKLLTVRNIIHKNFSALPGRDGRRQQKRLRESGKKLKIVFEMLKTILKSILYLGAIICCLAGLWVIYVTITNFREMEFPAWIVVLVLDAVWICLTFAPAFMLLRGVNTKTWHWVLIGIVEVVVVALVFCALFVMTVSLRNPG